MVTIDIKNCNLTQIYESGQCFRWEMLAQGGFRIPHGNHEVQVIQKDHTFQFNCSQQEFEDIWSDYFDLSTDYGAIIGRVDSKDRYLTEAVRYGEGLRILRQDVWEIIITFLLSQNSNIPRIRKNVRDLFALTDGRVPTPSQLKAMSEEDLRALGVGYRAKYLIGAGKFFSDYQPEQLYTMSYEQAHQTLMKCPGIGPKVADCICLFGLHHVDAFPIDTHIRQILSSHYPKGFPLEQYRGCAGILQQYMFYYDLKK
ncbi:DNA-3-methyladenine glycosylase [uncultured Ruthenibacterium sp.]|uniref:DNA-3-methyladenine glycosylase family protein n=1 Tax=uncultured Ruthenibacterium sp. TaxID=1905347 RepID=UPI00349EF3B5